VPICFVGICFLVPYVISLNYGLLIDHMVSPNSQLQRMR
jgi:hypothetical protein